MRKSALSLLLALLIVFSLVLVAIAHFSVAQTSGTNVNGIIGSDTTWIQANSPYTLTGNVLVNNGVTLNIQPGTTVNLGSYYIMVNGTLQAIGNSANPIAFNGGQITFTQYSNGWNESVGSGCIIENATVSSSVTIYNSAEMNQDNITNTVTIYTGINYGGGHQAIISNSTLEAGLSVNGDGLTIISNNNLQGLTLWYSNASVSGNTISGIMDYTDFWDNSNPDAWSNSTALIENNLVNNIGIEAWQGSKPNSPIILNNTILNGISLSSILGNPTPAILYNNIFNYGSQYAIELSIPGNINATYNWWGTTNTQAINQTIYDFKDDFNLGVVTFTPFLNAPNTQAPTFVNATADTGGSITPSGIIGLSYGSSRTFTVIPSIGYYITDVLVNGTSVGAVNSYNVQNVNGATTIEATFAPNPTATPSPAASPTPPPSATSTPTSSSTPTASPTASPTATPTVPEIPSVIIALAIILASSIATIYLHKKTPAPIIHEA